MNEANVWFLGDTHIGSIYCDTKTFKYVLSQIKRDKNAHVILMGDIIESGLMGKLGGWEQEINPQEQLEEAIKLLKPLKDKIDYSIIGNHELRIFKDTSIDISYLLAQTLDAKYLNVGGIINDYGPSIVVYHGSANSTNPELELNRALYLYPDADAICLAHVHQFFLKEKLRFKRDGSKMITYLLRTGGYIKEANYAMRRFMPISRTGSSVIKIRDGKISEIRFVGEKIDG